MYTILVRNDDTLVATQRENIFHKTSMVHKLRFIVDPITTKNGKEVDLRTCICTLEYKTPISNAYVPLILQPSSELYKDKLEYLIPIDTAITAEVGTVEMYLGWKNVTMNQDGTFEQYSRFTEKIGVEILPTTTWSDFIPSEKFDMLTQILLKNQAQNEQMAVYVEQINQMTQWNTLNKADNLHSEETEDGKQFIQLESMGMPIGDPVEVKGGNGNCDCEEGVPAVDFSDVEPDKDIEVDNVVEF